MCNIFLSLLKKDFKLMVSSKFFLLAAGSLILYSCYINFVYVNMDQEIYPVYLYDPGETRQSTDGVIHAESMEILMEKCEDGYSVGVDASGAKPQIYMHSSGIATNDHYRAEYAMALLQDTNIEPEIDISTTDVIGTYDKEMKSRREITSEFLFFELSAVGFLGLASMLFKEKQMGIIRVHGILPISRPMFILAKLALILIADLLFTVLLTIINLGFMPGLAVLPGVLVHAGILSLIMALAGILCAIRLPDFKQFSLLYLVLAVFITTPVFLAGQTSVSWEWINYHPMYHLFMAMKNAYFQIPAGTVGYYFISAAVILFLFLLVQRAFNREMAKEG